MGTDIIYISDRKLATARNIFRMFASMAHGATFGELCVRLNPASMNVNEKQLVLFGLLEGLIRRVDKYPITVSRNLFIDDEDNMVLRPTATVANASTAASIATADPLIVSTSPDDPIVVVAPPAQRSQRHRASRPLPRGEHCPRTAHHQMKAYSSTSQNCFGYDTSTTTMMTTIPMIVNNCAVPTTPTTPKFYNGRKTLDEICCKRGVSCQELEIQLARDRHVIVLLK